MSGGGDEVRLRVPDAPEFLRLAALCATRVARSAGLDTAETTGFAAAVADGCSRMIEAGPGDGRGRIDLAYRLREAELEVTGTCSTTGERLHVAAPVPAVRRRLGNDAA